MGQSNAAMQNCAAAGILSLFANSNAEADGDNHCNLVETLYLS